MKILYLTPDFVNFRTATYHGMMKALETYCDITYYGPGHKPFNDLGSSRDILEVIKHIYAGQEPDIILMWDIEGSGWAGDFTNMDKVNCLKVLWSVDIHNDAVRKRLPFMKEMGIGLVLMTVDKDQVTHAAKNFQTLGVPIDFYPFSVDPELYKPMNIPKLYDVSLLGSMASSYYPLRNKIHETLKNQNLNYHYPQLKRYFREGFARHINESKICLTGSSSYKYILQKYYEVTACGTLLMADSCMDLEYQHFISGHNFVEITAENVLEKVKYYLAHPDETKKIAAQGRSDILRYHTHDIRAKELSKTLKKYLEDQ